MLANYFRILPLSSVIAATMSCGDSGAPAGEDGCQVVELPVSGEPNGPVITDVAIELQPGDGIVVLATATDPQGTVDLRNIPQTIRLFQDLRCERSPIVLQDDLAGSGVEESFGIAAPRSDPLFNLIAAEVLWPVEVEFRDADDNQTSARVMARVINDIGGISTSTISRDSDKERDGNTDEKGMHQDAERDP